MAASPGQSTVMWLQGVYPLGLVWLDELGGLFQLEFYESMLLSLQSRVRHKPQKYFSWEKYSIFLPSPCDLAKCSQFCLSHWDDSRTTTPSSGSQQLQKVWVLQLPAGSPAQLPGMSSLGRLMCRSQWEGSQRGSVWRDWGARACITLPAALALVNAHWSPNLAQCQLCIAAALRVVRPAGAEAPLQQARCHSNPTQTRILQHHQSPAPHCSHATSSPNGRLCCKGPRMS